ncbi:MAG TPA: phage tail tube protein [Terriglobia bacterium]|nr:phage tail tube protein [Terriglobia bacterium]
MSTAAKSAWATLFQRYNGSAYATVEECTSITGPTQKGKAIDVTNMDSPSGFAEYVMGIIDGGTVQVDGNFTYATNQQGVLSDFQSKVNQQWKIALPGTQPGAGYWLFNGYIVDYAQDFKVADRITYKFSVQITGVPTFHTS